MTGPLLQWKGPPRVAPATGVDPAVAVRLPNEILVQIVQWAADNDTTRSDAIRELIESGLASKEATRRRRAAKDNT